MHPQGTLRIIHYNSCTKPAPYKHIGEGTRGTNGVTQTGVRHTADRAPATLPEGRLETRVNAGLGAARVEAAREWKFHGSAVGPGRLRHRYDCVRKQKEKLRVCINTSTVYTPQHKGCHVLTHKHWACTHIRSGPVTCIGRVSGKLGIVFRRDLLHFTAFRRICWWRLEGQ